MCLLCVFMCVCLCGCVCVHVGQLGVEGVVNITVRHSNHSGVERGREGPGPAGRGSPRNVPGQLRATLLHSNPPPPQSVTHSRVSSANTFKPGK